MKNKVFTIGTAHLDTVWNWTLDASIRRHIKLTMTENFDLFEKYPDYKFNFEGAYRYELMEEYYPDLFEKLRSYVKLGRWYPCGSSYENGDVNTPSPEALFRNILYGNGYFAKKFGIRSKDIFLPDCFGFGYALPSIMRHANLTGFITQKLTWGSAYGIPFDLGKWYGVNGDFVYASLNPGGYTQKLKAIRDYPFVKEKLDKNNKIGLDATAVFHGTGDIGGAPKSECVAVLQSEINNNKNTNTEVLSSTTGELFGYLENLSEDVQNKLPVHNNELVLTTHSTGGYTSRAIGKRWNKRNEILGDMAERASVVAEALGIQKYPQDNLNKHWKRVIAHQFHDDLPGTSLQRVYLRSWNDYGVSLNGFKDEYVNAVAMVSKKIDTMVDGIPLLVHNPLEFEVKAPVLVTIEAIYSNISVLDYNKNIVPSQIVSRNGNKITLVFVPTLPPIGYKTYQVIDATAPFINDQLRVGDNVLENENLLVKLDDNGDICSIFDKKLSKELLNAPIRNVLFKYKGSKEYPAWEMPVDYTSYPAGSATKVGVQIVDNGGAKVSLKVTQQYKKSIFNTTISLFAGSDRVDCYCELDWRSRNRLLKIDFQLATKNKEATYDLGLGTIKRPTNTKKLYEVPAQNFADITNLDNSFGVSVLSECKFGWDKPSDNELRLTVLHTPYMTFKMKDSEQHKMELGLNRYAYSITAHSGEVGTKTQQQARMFVESPVGFVVDKHIGELKNSYSFASISDEGVMLKAFKKAENTDEYIVRFYEGENKPHKNITFKVATDIVSAKEMYASEEYLGNANVQNGCLIFDIEPYKVKTFAITVAKKELAEIEQTPISIPFNSPLVSTNNNRSVTIKGQDYALPKELWQSRITSLGLNFNLGDVLLADGQTIDIPTGAKKLYIIASSLESDKQTKFTLDNKEVYLNIASAKERIAAWDMIGLSETANIKTDTVAFEVTHTHSAKGDNLAELFYGFRYCLDVEGAGKITLPKDKNIAIFAMTTVKDAPKCELTTDLYDVIKRRPFDYTYTIFEKIRDVILQLKGREYNY